MLSFFIQIFLFHSIKLGPSQNVCEKAYNHDTQAANNLNETNGKKRG